MFRYKLRIIIILLFLSSFGFSQKKVPIGSELGIIGGFSFYMGDVNQEKLFYDMHTAFGGLFRYNFNTRFALKVSVMRHEVSAEDSDFDYQYQIDRNYSFATKISEGAAQFEINFLRLDPMKKNSSWSPYVTGGIAAWYPHDLEEKKVEIGIPFGIGIKYLPNKKLTLGIEWGMRKTFTDGLDGLTETYNAEVKDMLAYKQKTFVNNYDYYSYIGIIITFRPFDASYDCPAIPRLPKFNK